MEKPGAADRVKLLVLALLLLPAAPTWAAQPQTDAEYWRATTLTLSYAKQFISNERCYSTANYLFSCIHAVNAAGSFLKSPMRIVPDDRIAPQERVLSRVPALAVIGQADLDHISGNSPWERAQKATVERQHLKEASATNFALAKTADAKIDFITILMTIRDALPANIPSQMMLGAAISAHLRVFDAHASIQPTARVDANFSGGKAPAYFGIGISIRLVAGGVRVDDVFPGTPAERAGLRIGDLITAIAAKAGGESVATPGRTMRVITDLILGPEGTLLTLTVSRDVKALSFTMPRAHVTPPTVRSAVIRSDRDQIGYLQLRNFEHVGTCDKVRRELIRFEQANVRGVVLDLRRNGGGQTREGVCVAGLFVGFKTVVGIKSVPVTVPGRAESDTDTNSHMIWEHGFSSYPSRLPLVVVIDAGSASASEVAVGALQFYKRAWIVGERSYGKGSEQTSSIMDDNDTLTLSETTARFYLPNGMTIQRVGIVPDFEVPFVKGASPADRFEPREADDFPEGLPALNAAQLELRPTDVAAIRSCVNGRMGNGKAVPLSDAPYAADYQKAYAVAVLACSLGECADQ
jgi:carboxyl-terminal processing protease